MSFHSADQAAPAFEWRTVTPHDTTSMPAGCRGVYVGGTGDVAAVGADGNALIFKAVPTGTFMPIGPRRINATNTTATLMLALY